MLPVWPEGGVDGRTICWPLWFCASSSGVVYCAFSSFAAMVSSAGGLLCPVRAVSGSD
jgi:hypothetical protein